MKTYITTTGEKALISKLTKYPELINREMESVMKQQARALCVEYGRVSGPGDGMGEAPIDKAKKEVETDVRRVFATIDSPWRVFQMLKTRDVKLANAYWHTYKKKEGNYMRSMDAIRKKAGLPQGMSPDAQRAARTGSGGRVPEDFTPVSLANSKSVSVLIRKLQQRVGMAKAGWYCAAKALGSRVRGSYDSGGETVWYEKFTDSVRKVARRFPTLGGATITNTNGKVEIAIFTSAGHARKALSEDKYQSATARGQKRFAAALARAVTALNKKIFKAA